MNCNAIWILLFSLLPFTMGQISICPTREITASSGIITSPDYPDKYPQDIDCTLTLNHPLGTSFTFTFTFTKIDIEGGDGQCYDSLEISGNLSQVFSGRTIPAPFMPGLNVVKLRMKSDDSVEQTGFQLIFTTSESMNQPTAVSVCPTRTITPNATGRVHSPGFMQNSNYSANLDCMLTLHVPPNKEVKVTYSHIDIEHSLECTKDKLIVTNGSSTFKACDSFGSPVTETSTFKKSEYVSFYFASDASGSGRGFVANYELFDDPGSTCTRLSTSDSGSNAILGVGILGAVVVVMAIVMSILFCRLWKRKRDYTQPTIQLPKTHAQAMRELPPVPVSEGGYEEPAEYQKLDSSRRVPMDANYKSLNANYTQLNRNFSEVIQPYASLS